MRGTDVHQEGLFSYLSPESRIPKHHPLRPVREMVDIALGELSGQFESMYSDTGRRSIPPEKLLRLVHGGRSPRIALDELPLAPAYFVNDGTQEIKVAGGVN